MTIKQNNGWRRIDSIKKSEKEESFYNLPKPGLYDLVTTDREIIYRYNYRGSISCDMYIQSNITHFRKTAEHKLPKK